MKIIAKFWIAVVLSLLAVGGCDNTQNGSGNGQGNQGGGTMVKDPVFTPVSGFYTGTQTITIETTTPGAQIRYTIDGSMPSATEGIIYSEPISIDHLCIVHAIAYKTGWTSSTVGTAVYAVNSTLPTPSFSEAGGLYTNEPSVVITSMLPGSLIRYTTDGSLPSRTNGILYDGPVSIDGTLTLKAIAYISSLPENADSPIRSVLYTLQAGAPHFSLDAGSYSNAQEVAITSETAGAIIRYTTDGSDPSRSIGQLYTTPFVVSTHTTIKAIAYLPDWQAGSDSVITSAEYSFKTVDPVFNLDTDFYSEPQSISLSCATDGASIYYSVDGSLPTPYTGTLYTGPISFVATTMIKTVAVRAGFDDSSVVSRMYVITCKADIPAVSIDGGTFDNSQNVVLTCDTYGSIIKYTTDGTTPNRTKGAISNGDPIGITETTTLKAIAYVPAWPIASDSLVLSATYTLRAADPVFSVRTGTYTSEQTVTLTTATAGANIRYTDDGTTPTETVGIIYEGDVAVASCKTLKAIAYKSGYSMSAERSETYTLRAVAPEPSVPFGIYTYAQDVMLETETEGASIHYTINGLSPSSSVGESYVSAVSITSSGTLKAVAYKAGFADSPLLTGDYTITGRVATPSFSIPAGTYDCHQSIVITCATDGSAIMYTTDGSDPSRENGTVYEDGVLIDGAKTLKAIAYVPEWQEDSNSAIQSATYNLQVSAPTFTPSEGMYVSQQSVIIETTTVGAMIRYTTDGSTPTYLYGNIYDEPINVDATTTIKAIAYNGTIADSEVATADYTIIPLYPGNEGLLTASTVGPTSFWITWTQASAETIPLSDIKYKIVQSYSNNITSAHEIETLGSGTVVKDWTNDLCWNNGTTSWELVGLAADTDCYYNVLVKVGNGPAAAYVANVRKTLPVVKKPPAVNGPVYALACDPVRNILYMGGFFSRINPISHFGAILDPVSGTTPSGVTQPDINGVVWTSISDGNGGWYIGGDFTTINGVTRNRIARINSDGSLHAWNPDANQMVRVLALDGDTVFIGGKFTSLGGQARNRIAAVSVATGTVTSWDPDANDNVYSFALKDNILFVGGAFTTIGGQARNRLAALDTATGTATDWNPDSSSTILHIAIYGNTMYVGSSSIGGQKRYGIAAVDIVTGIPTTWNPSMDDPSGSGMISLYALVAVEGILYVSGYFDRVCGQSSPPLVAFDIATGTLMDWNPSIGGNVLTMAFRGDSIYFGGSFRKAGGLVRSRIAEVNAVTGSVTGWDPCVDMGYPPNLNNTFKDKNVYTISVSNNIVFAGGSFGAIGGQVRNNLAAVDFATNEFTSWNPDVNGNVYTLASSNDTVYAGGQFTTIGGQIRNNMAAVDASTGIVTGWDPNADNTIYSLATTGDTVYAGGSFTTIGGQTRNKLAALNSDTAEATEWDPNVGDGCVKTVVLNGSAAYVGGGFNYIGTDGRHNLAAVDTTTGVATSWNPQPDYEVLTLAIKENTVYAGGHFTYIGGKARSYLAALDITSGAALEWIPNPNYIISSMAVTGDTIYVGGQFTSAGGQSRKSIAALDLSSGLATEWNPGINEGIYSLSILGENLYAGGNYTIDANVVIPFIEALDLTTGEQAW